MQSEQSPEQKQQEESSEERIADVRDLVTKPKNASNPHPEETVDNPTVTPQTIDDPSDLRDDLKPFKPLDE
ncbi:MAG: hypothetical protein SW833_18155 [Cyanobacteriota bacterium]|nr:hypothetical protein [Cyanobacteriota bacterium]